MRNGYCRPRFSSSLIDREAESKGTAACFISADDNVSPVVVLVSFI